MTRFDYRLSLKLSDHQFEAKNNDRLEEELMEFLGGFLRIFGDSFGHPSGRHIGHIGAFSVRADCTELQCNDLIKMSCQDIYLCLDENTAEPYFMGFHTHSMASSQYIVYSSINEMKLGFGDPDKREREINLKRFIDNFVGSEKKNIVQCGLPSLDSGRLFVSAHCTGEKRKMLIERSVSKASVGIKKIYGGDICFWPNNERRNQRLNKLAAEERAAALFMSKRVEDPLDRDQAHTYWDADFHFSTSTANRPAAFKLVPSQFLRRAELMPPEKPQPSASSFAQWVYSLYGDAFGDDKDRELGKTMEEAILDMRQKAAQSTDNSLLRSIGSDWRLIHNGLHFGSNDVRSFFEAKDLFVNGQPLRASPDLIYRNGRTSEMIIVEIKYSRLRITTNLWPNVWAQLWCYAQIRPARDAERLTVIGEVWGERWTRGFGRGRNREEGVPLLCLRASVRRDPRAPAYDKFFRRLFEIYCGKG